MINLEKIKAMTWGLAVADAVGVPVEFKSREFLKRKLVTDMFGFGSHYQPSGTWSDDTSMTIATMENFFLAKNRYMWFNERKLFWRRYGLTCR